MVVEAVSGSAIRRGHTDGVPDAVVQRLSELLSVVDGWRET
jgi:putative hydrolase of the HAD superfamily